MSQLIHSSRNRRTESAREMDDYRAANPWVIVNVASIGTHCGRYPTLESAKERAASYRGGCVSFNEMLKEVYVSEIPSC